MMGSRKILLCWLVVTTLLVEACSSVFPAPEASQTPAPSRTPRPEVGQLQIRHPVTPTLTPFQPMMVDMPAQTSEALAGPEVTSAAPFPGLISPTVAASPQALPTLPPSLTPPAPPAQALPTEVSSPTATLPPPSPTPQAVIWVDPRLPAALKGGLALPDGSALTDAPEGAALRVEPGGQQPAGSWVYALAAPFPTKVEGVTADLLRQSWMGEAVGPFAGRPLLVDESTAGAFTALWGAPGVSVQVLPSGELLQAAWKSRPAWAILPFEAVEPRWKVLAVDGQSPLRKEFDPASYALSLPVSVSGDQALCEALLAKGPISNHDPGKLTTLAMTGVTALVRATAFAMERKGIEYPGRDVRDWLRSADLTHISNEVPFAENCPFPNPTQPDMRFCSDTRYIGLLEDVGTDIVELTGDHFQDWGEEAMQYTLELYKERGWRYYGGGANLDEGRQALLVEHNGNRLAFIGCNAKRGAYAQASAKHPGAVPCDMDWMTSETARLKAEGYLVIATFQHFEYYSYQAQPDQKRDFRALAEAGAAIVSGSQAHQPQAMEFDEGAFIHYGLGNLFFDQYDVSLASRQAFIDRHVFYGGRYLGVELLPVMFVDYARPRPMTPEERSDLLEAVFSASGW